MTQATILQKRTNRFLRFSEIGAACVVFLAITLSTLDPDLSGAVMRWAVLISGILFMLSLIMLFIYRNTDEYTRSLWYSAARTACHIKRVFSS